MQHSEQIVHAYIDVPGHTQRQADDGVVFREESCAER